MSAVKGGWTKGGCWGALTGVTAPQIPIRIAIYQRILSPTKYGLLQEAPAEGLAELGRGKAKLAAPRALAPLEMSVFL